jgi:hypothetical protein
MTGVRHGSARDLAANGAQVAATGLGETALAIEFASQERFFANGDLIFAPHSASAQGVAEVLPMVDDAAAALGQNAKDYLRLAPLGATVVVRSWHEMAGVASPWLARPTLFAAEAKSGQDTFECRVRANPGFLYKAAESAEYLITISEDDAPLTDAHAYALLDLSEEVALAAKHSEAPILFMQSPVAAFRASSDGDGSREGPRSPSSVSLRIAVGFDGTRPNERTRFESEITSFALDHGYQLHLGDRRAGKVRGDWFEVAEAEPLRVERSLRDLVSQARVVKGVLPVAIVGPARVGSTAACLGVLKALGAGVTGISVTAFGDIAVIILGLACGPGPDLGVPSGGPGSSNVKIDTPMGRTGAAALEPLRGLDSLRDALSLIAATSLDATLSDNQISAAHSVDLKPAQDYLLMAGRRRETRREIVDLPSYSIWSYWEASATLFSADKFIDCIVTALEDCIGATVGRRPGVNVDSRCDYARALVTTGGRLRGRGKFAVPHFGRNLGRRTSDLLREVCISAESRAKELLWLRCAEGPKNDSRNGLLDLEVHLVWRERWLGSLGPIL